MYSVHRGSMFAMVGIALTASCRTRTGTGRGRGLFVSGAADTMSVSRSQATCERNDVRSRIPFRRFRIASKIC